MLQKCQKIFWYLQAVDIWSLSKKLMRFYANAFELSFVGNSPHKSSSTCAEKIKQGLKLGKTLGTISAVQMDSVQIDFQPPPPQATGPVGATFFAEN